MNGNTILATREWMYTTLVADATVTGIVGTRIYAEEAPQEAAFPLIVFAHIGNVDQFRSGNNGRVNKAIWLVRVVAAGSSVEGNVKTVANRFDPLLLQQNVLYGGVLINYVQHDQDHVRADSQEGIPFSYLGSYYLVYSQPA